MEILSCPNATQWLAGTQAIELARQANDRLAQPISTVLSAYGFGWHLEAGIQILRMSLAGVFKKFPNLLRFCIARFCIEHLVFATDFPYVPLADARPFVENAPFRKTAETFSPMEMRKNCCI